VAGVCAKKKCVFFVFYATMIAGFHRRTGLRSRLVLGLEIKFSLLKTNLHAVENYGTAELNYFHGKRAFVSFRSRRMLFLNNNNKQQEFPRYPHHPFFSFFISYRFSREHEKKTTTTRKAYEHKSIKRMPPFCFHLSSHVTVETMHGNIITSIHESRASEISS
jgi:hypothetical protein